MDRLRVWFGMRRIAYLRCGFDGARIRIWREIKGIGRVFMPGLDKQYCGGGGEEEVRFFSYVFSSMV